MITVQEAHGLILDALPGCTPGEAVPLAELSGRVIAEEVRAGFPMPRFTNAAMDGFAVMLDDLRETTGTEPVRLTVSQDIPAGALSTEPLRPGSCARIMTGAPLPPGAEAVVPFEETSGFGSCDVAFYKAPKRGANIRLAGEEVGTGELLVRRGTRLTPSEIAVMAAFGLAGSVAYRRPKVALLTVGDELQAPGEPAAPLSIYNSNLPMLAASVTACGAIVSSSLQLPDDPLLIRKAVETSLESCDLLVTAGGISTGQYDFMKSALSELDVIQRFWKVAQKPGKPLFFGTAPSGSLVFSLPGNPVSALCCFLEYCVPTLNRLQGAEPPAKIGALLDTPFPVDRKRHRFLFGRLRSENGRLLCSVSGKTESHMLTAASGANCIVEAPPAPSPLPEGSLVTCTPLPWSTAY
jgi:molybdopterin molybdotransferase